MQLKRYEELYNENIDSHSRVEDPEVSLPDYLPFLSVPQGIYGPEFPTLYSCPLLYSIHKL